MKARRATPADAPGIARVHVASWQVAYRGFFPAGVLENLSVTERAAQWAERLAQPDPTIWVTGDTAHVTGFLDLVSSRDADLPAPAFAEIAALYVDPAAWDTGCGRALCSAAFAHLRQTNTAQTVFVWVLAANARARRFYQRNGFAPDDAEKAITLYGTTLAEVRYRQSLF